MSNFRIYRKRKELARWSNLMLILSMLVSNCNSASLINSKPLWRVDERVPTIFTSSCDPVTGRCLEWLPIVDSRLGDYVVGQDSEFDRTQLLQTQDVDKVSDIWREAAPGGVEIGNLSNQMATGRLTKKDVFMSRGWGTGGMPFSVLYMSPRVNHPPPSGTTQVEVEKNVDHVRKKIELPNERVNQPNYQVALRNGGSGQPRRHYSIIPQLFISYGWGPSGK